MRRTAIAVGLALFLMGGQTLADASAGFETGSCEYDDIAGVANAPRPGSGTVRNVDDSYTSGQLDTTHFQTIGAAEAAAAEGDAIVVQAGTYSESVTVDTPGLRIRGVDRDGVVLNGGNVRLFGLHVVADRVVVENMTGHNYTHTAFYWDGVTGYMGRFLTGYSNRGYGLYGYDSRCGEFNDSITTGNGDSGFYIGGCYPCDAVIHHVDSTENALGYSGTNAGGNLTLRDSNWWDNGLGVVPNTLNTEPNPPQRGITIENNTVSDNNNKVAPGEGITGQYWGGGIVIPGGQGNHIVGNEVTDNGLAGIALTPIETEGEFGPIPVYVAAGNTVIANTVSHDAAEWPDAADLAQGASSGPNNCWSRNTFGTSAPVAIETVWSCSLQMTPPGGDPRIEQALVMGQIPDPEHDGCFVNGRCPSDWSTWPSPIGRIASASVDQPTDDGDGDYTDDGAIDRWLPALGLS